ncbi:DNA-binding response regulator [Paenibacillus sp. GD4]|uniref:DNA-binding response regulator n=1 Tax=Paenibacillus sp. GD4 TaxID=3068890 RepID=UPI0027BA3A17|nr:DNA-binding response regulator [Paenibacillus sp. GD4]
MSLSAFELQYEEWITRHRIARRGERLRRLEEGHAYAERHFIKEVWWPATGSFQYLHPEYEVYDYKDGTRFLDFAYIRPHLKLCMEIDGYGPHLRHVSRHRFSDQWQRQNHLIIDGWRILRFSADDVSERPRLCQQMIQQFLGKWLGEDRALPNLTRIEKDIVTLAIRLCRPVTPSDLCEHVGIESKYAYKLLHQLVSKQWFAPASGTKRIRSYQLTIDNKTFLL